MHGEVKEETENGEEIALDGSEIGRKRDGRMGWIDDWSLRPRG